jgi:ubiquinol-cytochrome c reductase cytochrome b subunit
MPVSLSHNYVYRSSLGLTYASQVVTRLVLTLHYIRTFDRLIDYGRDVERGTFIRYMHANGASLFLLLMFLHVARRMYYNSSNKKSLWISGIVILLLSMRVAFLGYVLPYGQMSYWGATVIINLLSIVSDTLVVWLWRGYVVSKFTLTRFYTLHFLLPLAMAVLLLRHLHLLHGTRGSSLSYAPVKLSFFPFFAVKDAMMWLFYLTVFLLFVCLYSNLLGDAENYIPANPLVTPVHIKPEWYFLFAYAILRCIPNKTLRVLALAAAVVVPIIQALRFSSSASTSIGFLAFTFCLLTALGGMPIVKHYFLLSQCFSLIYFRLVTILA